MTKKVNLAEYNKELEQNLEEIFKNDQFKHLLDVIATRHNYSLGNMLKIIQQKPDIKMIRSYDNWKKIGRQVKKGETGLEILVPTFRNEEVTKVDETGFPLYDVKGQPITEKKKVLRGFVTGKVFDISQTIGKEVPSLKQFIQEEMKNENNVKELYDRFLGYLKEKSNETDLPVKEEEHTGEKYGGYYDKRNHEIIINTETAKSPMQKFRVLIHEYAHAQLHHIDSELKDLERGHKEAQADSCAYIVNKYFGLDTEESTVGYIASWAKDLRIAKKAISEVQEVSMTIIDEINEAQMDRINQFYKEHDPSKVKEELEKKGVKIEPETKLQLLDMKNGFIISGQIEKRESDEVEYFRTNKNRIIPLDELIQDYEVINNQLEIEKILSVKENLKNSNFEIIVNGNNSRSLKRDFKTLKEATQYINRIGISQSLNQESMRKKENKTLKPQEEKLLSKRIGKYFGDHNFCADYEGNISIGWHIMKNPDIKTKQEFKRDIQNLKQHLVTTKRLLNAINQAEKNSMMCELER
ncbi:LtrC-like protein [Halalkalibacterium halodurans]|uniref:ArdC-like ssDNA-binding domain-containing protein n=1 Tax=Halalkalibacterium halodurans TaxID=86665 RepID=UPI0010681F8C|nr:ArdC-like ssDNA-binding domain-containing protein [Halalkalibacterium halodurans]TES50321.1 LtrC-like protein [Halalkalibacterium halodurans]